MAVLTIKWDSASRFAPQTGAVTPTNGEEIPAAAVERPRADRPMIIYITTGETEGFDKIEKVVLTDDKIAVGTNAFRCIKMRPEDADQDPILKEAGDEVPRFVFVTPDYEPVKVLEGRRVSVSGFYGAMKATAKKAYATDFDRNIRDLVKLLNEFDKINNELKLITAKEERLDNPSESELAKIRKEKEELEVRSKEAADRKAELLNFELREEFAAEPA